MKLGTYYSFLVIASIFIVQLSVIKQYKQTSYNVIPMLLCTNCADSVHNVATPPHNCWALTGTRPYTSHWSVRSRSNRPHEARLHSLVTVWSCLSAGEPASKASNVCHANNNSIHTYIYIYIYIYNIYIIYIYIYNYIYIYIYIYI